MIFSLSRVGLRMGALVALAGFGNACGDQVAPVAPAAAAIQAVGIAVVGPDRLAPGQSAQFSAILTFADGTTQTHTGSPVQWLALGTMHVTGSGVGTGLGVGAGWIKTSYGRLSSQQEVVILPDGTYRLAGKVLDEAAGSEVIGASVAAEPGVAAATTNRFGQYALYGVPPTARITIGRDGYDTLEQPVLLTGDTTRDFHLTASARMHLAGSYTVAFDVEGPCEQVEDGLAPLQEDLRHRRYEAVLTQLGAVVEVMLTEPRFRPGYNRFTGTVDGTGVTFDLGLPARNPRVVEELPGGPVLLPSGKVVVKGAASSLTGVQEIGAGGLSRLTSAFPQLVPMDSCGPFRLTLSLR